jgi:hypothetical protein
METYSPYEAVASFLETSRRVRPRCSGCDLPHYFFHLGNVPIAAVDLLDQPVDHLVDLVHSITTNCHRELHLAQVARMQRTSWQIWSCHDRRIGFHAAPAERYYHHREQHHRRNDDEEEVHNADRAT